MPALPFKPNQDRRHRIPRQKHKVTNWPAYEAGLRQRGSLRSGSPRRRSSLGGGTTHDPRRPALVLALPILTALTLRAVFEIATRLDALR